jgi:hypothetical protein
MLILIRMLRDDFASADGHSIEVYAEGKEYMVPDFIAHSFVNLRKSAELVNPVSEIPEPLEIPVPPAFPDLPETLS